MANHVFIACSLDGFIAKRDGDLAWLVDIPNETGGDYGFADFLAKMDAVVMGRNTFRTVLSFDPWPYTKPLFVASRTLREIPAALADKAEIVRGTPADIVADLRRRGFENLYVDGGMTIQEFLKADLIDEMIVTTIAKLIGDGIPLFGSTGAERAFRVADSEILGPLMVKSRFVRDRSSA